MKKYYLGLLVIIVFLITLKVYAQQEPPKNLLEIKDPIFERFGPYQYYPVIFSHASHANQYKLRCQVCHHIYKNGRNWWTPEQKVKKCSDCHGKTKDELIIAYHSKCSGCHKRNKENYPLVDAPIVECNRCHVKSIEIKNKKD
jgi:cytochrome c553